jgi:hypothetical protein
METLGNEILPNSALKYYCNFCHYGTCKKSSFDDHNLSAKHKKAAESKQMETLENNILPKIFFCENCEKNFKNRSGLWKHKKKCFENEEHVDSNNLNQQNDSVELIKYLMKENSEFKQMIIEQNKQMIEMTKNVGTHITTTNSHNKSFNLQFFLNETCKDAMNIMDFVDSIKLQLSDLETVGEIGYVDGISNIIVKNLKELDVTKRPIHCADKKREILYVKDENKWEKDEEKKKLRKVIKRVASKNQRLLLKFKEIHPDCNTSSSKYSDQYNTIIVESMGGSGDNDLAKEEKIIRKITKEVVIDKEM